MNNIKFEKAFKKAKKIGAISRDEYVYYAAIFLDKMGLNVAACGPLDKEIWLEYLDKYSSEIEL